MRKIILSIFVIFVALITTSSNAFAQTKRLTEIEEYKLKLVETFYEQADYKNAYNIILPMAYEGNFIAQYYLSDMYSNGLWVKKDLLKGLNLYYQSIKSSSEYLTFSEYFNQTNNTASTKNKYYLDSYISSCKIVCDEYLYIFSKSELTNISRLGIAEYYYNIGTKETYQKSAKFYENSPYCLSRFKIGKLYYEGVGVEIDKNKGLSLLERAYEDECGDDVATYLGKPFKFTPVMVH